MKYVGDVGDVGDVGHADTSPKTSLYLDGRMYGYGNKKWRCSKGHEHVSWDSPNIAVTIGDYHVKVCVFCFGELLRKTCGTLEEVEE